MGTARRVDFKRTLRGVTREWRKLYPTTPMVRVSLLVHDMRAIRNVMDMNNIRDVTYWAL